MDNLMTPVNLQQKPYKPTSILGQVAVCVWNLGVFYHENFGQTV